MKSKFFFLFFILATCILFNVSGQDSLLTRPGIISGNNKVLIINSFDAMSLKVRKNKKELFAQLADSLKQILYEGIQARGKFKAIVVPDLMAGIENSDSSLFSLMDINNASTAIVIKTLEVYFDQTGVEVTGVKNDKTRTASYDICAEVLYKLYRREVKPLDSKTTLCEYYTERNVVSGFFAAGPDVVGKRKDTFKIIEKNARKYLWNFSYELNKLVSEN